MNLHQNTSSGNHEIVISSNFQNFGPGNIIPHWCYHKVTSCGKPDFVAITILSELLYLYRLNNGEEFANSYVYFERKFNLTRTQLQDATLRLHKSGLVERTFRTVLVHGHKIPSILHLKLNIEALKALMPSGNGGDDKSNNDPENGAHADEFDNNDSIGLSLDNKQAFFYARGFVNSSQADLEISHPQLNKISIRKSRSSGSSFCKIGRCFQEFHPLDLSDVRALQAASGRDFDSNFCNQLLLRIAEKYPDYKFPTKTAFMSYMSKMLEHELRDAVVVSNGSFRFKDSISLEDNEALAKERYLESVERTRDTSLAGQLRRKIAGVFGVNLAYQLLSNSSFYVDRVDDSCFVFKANSQVNISEYQHERLLGEIRSVYGQNIESLSFVSKDKKIINIDAYSSMNARRVVDTNIDEGIWAKMRRSLIAVCGEAVDRHWFSKLIPTINDEEKTISLKCTSGFIRDWIETNYRSLIERVIPSGFKLAEVVV